MKPSRPVLVGAVVLGLLGAPALTARAASTDGEGAATPAATIGELIAGTSTYQSGTYAWTDYAYDDRGPDTNARPGGDAAYPAGMNPNNVADLIQLQLRDDGGQLGATVVLETLEPGTRPVIGLAVDSDDDRATGAAGLPGWEPAASLGVDQLFVLRHDGGSTRHADATGTWADGAPFGVATDTHANTLSATLPFALPTSDFAAVAVVGYEDATGATWLDGATPIHDLAFVPGEDPSTPYLQGVSDAIVNFAAGGDPVWQDYQQSAIIAGATDPGAAIATIDVAKLRGGHTDPPRELTKGFHTFLYRSELDLGEGVVGSGNGVMYAGPYQPYLVWAPGGSTAGLPLVLYLHGSSQTHLSSVNTAPYSPGSAQHVPPGVDDPVVSLPDTFFDHFDAVVAWPLGRGPGQFYRGPAEQDPLDVHADVIPRLGLDADRVMLAGLSMGGMGTFRLAELYPDKWSLAYSDVGYDAAVKLPENLTALPVRFQNGAPDYLVHVNNALATRDLLDAAGTVDYRSYILHQRHHQPAVALAECIYQWSFTLDRVTNPARVRYTVNPALFDVNEATGLELVYDGAYWVDGMVSAGGKASVDLTSKAFGYRPVPQPTTRTVEQNLTAGRDFCGPSDVSTHDSWDEQGKVVTRETIEPQAVVEGTLTNLTHVTIDAGRAGVPAGTLALTTTGPVTLTLTGLAPGTIVRRGDTSSVADAAGVAVITLVTDANSVSIG